jgi:hypothetical protein
MKVDVMQSILAFIYEGKISVKPENVVEIFSSTKKFKIEEVEKQIIDRMGEYIIIDNFIGFYVATKNGNWNEKNIDVLTFMIQ